MRMIYVQCEEGGANHTSPNTLPQGIDALPPPLKVRMQHTQVQQRILVIRPHPPTHASTSCVRQSSAIRSTSHKTVVEVPVQTLQRPFVLASTPALEELDEVLHGLGGGVVDIVDPGGEVAFQGWRDAGAEFLELVDGEGENGGCIVCAGVDLRGCGLVLVRSAEG